MEERPMRDGIAFLEDWYAQQCDGDWEHASGVRIDTLDNPGWYVEIDLERTPWEGRELEREIIERTERDWYHAWSDGQKWEAACGPQNLGEVIDRFRAFVSKPVEALLDDEAPREAADLRNRIRFEPPSV